MPDQDSNAEKKLQKLGQHVRDGFAKENPTSEPQLDTVRDAVRQQWEQERKAKSQHLPPPPARGKERGKNGPEPDEGR